MTLAERGAVREALLQKKITWQQTLEAITASRAKPWQTKEWDAIKSKHIKQCCEQCGSTEKPTLHHLRQPVGFAIIHRVVRYRFLETYKEEHLIHRTEMAPVERNACPRCSATSLYQMKTGDRRWKCHGKKNGRECWHEFLTPATVLALSSEQKKARSQEWRSQRDAYYADFLAAYEDQIGTEAVLLSMQEHDRYMSMEDTATFCKKCAFLWDMKGLKLCGICRQRYHLLMSRCCAQCDTQHQKLCSICGHRYHAIGYPTCFNCRRDLKLPSRADVTCPE